ncbi:MAG: hypothetical protein J6X92_00745 [Bacteroidales bacterium]|nr:hypothetical protein [Bacteroidales bacterium]
MYGTPSKNVMNKSRQVHILCYDDRKSFADEIKKMFAGNKKYDVISFHNKKTFVDYCSKSCSDDHINIGVIGFVESPDKIQLLNIFLAEIQNVLPNIRLLIFTQQKSIKEVSLGIVEKVDGVIPINNNMLLRTNNNIKRIISEHYLHLAKIKRNRLFFIALSFLIFCIISIIMFYRLTS